MTPPDPLLHSRLGPYQIDEVIGSGGMGRVYAATNPSAGTRVAIKVIAQQYAADRELLDRFFTEARAVNLVKHENIVAVYDLDRLPDGRPYIVMELVDGTSLRTHTLANTPLPTLLGWIVEVLVAVGAAHTREIVHRDLKPDNVMISSRGRARVLDFGIAKLTTVDRTLAPRTATGIVLGTPEYMAPEQIEGGGAEPRSDLYAIGRSGQRTTRVDRNCLGALPDTRCTLPELRATLRRTKPAQADNAGTMIYTGAGWIFLDEANDVTQLGRGCDPAR